MNPANFIKRLALLALIFGLAAPLGLAQQVYWSPASGTLQQGKANRLQLHFEGCSPDGTVALPSIAGVDFSQIGQSNSMNIFNSQVVQKLILEYQVSPTVQGSVAIPSFTVKTNKGDLDVPQANYEVVEATVGTTGMKPDDIFKSELSVVEDTIYEGQIFTLRYALAWRQDFQNRVNDISHPKWTAPSVISKGFDSYRSSSFTIQNTAYSGVIFETQAMATRSGTITLPKVNQIVSMVVGRRRGFIFDDPVVESYNISSQEIALEVKPLPTSVPASFSGAVGEFQFESTIVPEIVQVGEPVTWTLKLSGSGNWPQGINLNPRPVSSTFRSIQPDIKKDISEDSPFDGSLTEDIVLIPTKDGDFKFGPVEFSFFNPKTDRYETISIPEKIIQVNPLAPQSLQQDPQMAPPSASAPAPQYPPLEFELDPSGVNLLSKPIEMLSAPTAEGDSPAAIPQGGVKLRYLFFSFAIPSILWAGIALARAIAFDPNKGRRKAYRDLKAVAMGIDDSEEHARAAQLAWREAAKRFWEIGSEEPSPEDIASAVAQKANPSQGERWKALWLLSDKILFGKRPPSFKEWQADLRDTLSQLNQPGVSISQFFSTRAWFASLALSALIFSLSDGIGNEGLKHYENGAFEEAQTAWQADLETAEQDWTIRHNLGLAAAQQEKWGQAVAYWTSAFLLNTHSPELNWNLKVALSKSGAYYPTLARLVKGDGIMAYISLLTPAQWEQTAYLAMLLAGLAFSAWVAFVYVPNMGRVRIALAIVGLLSVASVFGADWARREYGLLANPEAIAAITTSQLKSVPTDLDVEQITSPLPEGSICLITKRHLGWVKVELPNGEQGWARIENFAHLYGEPALTPFLPATNTDG